MLSPGTQTCADVEHTHVVTCKKCVFTWNAPMWSAGTHQEHTIIYLKHSYVHPQHAACGLIKRTRALKHTFLSLKHTCVPAEYTANDQGAVPGIQAGGKQEGDKGRQMNPSARRAVPDIQAGRQTNLSGGDNCSLGFVSLHLSPVECLARLSRRTDSRRAWMPGTALLGGQFHPQAWGDKRIEFVSRCLPAWMPLWVDGFICLPLSPSLDVWHSRSAVSFTSRGSVLLAGSGLPSTSALASVIPCLVDVGDRVLCLPFIWTSILLGLVVGRLPCLSLATPCLFVQCLVISCGLSLSLLAFGVPS